MQICHKIFGRYREGQIKGIQTNRAHLFMLLRHSLNFVFKQIKTFFNCFGHAKKCTKLIHARIPTIHFMDDFKKKKLIINI